MRYLILRKQVGEGCDYTIGCGMVYEFLEFDGPLEDAVKHFTNRIIYPPDGNEEEALSIFDVDDDLREAWIVPADAAIKVNLKTLRKAHEAKEKKAQDREKDAREKAEFDRLKAKFGK